ncbi:MAG: SPOR domain-containing protein [Clostridia bacterium]|nr:SPOR domain-containing protein [Clostridia bacterium]
MKPLIHYFNQIKDKFWVAMILIPLITFVFGFILTAIILLATGKFGIASKDVNEIPETVIEVPVEKVQTVSGKIEFESTDFFFVQLGSFNAESNAEAASENLEDKNIYAIWIKFNTQYKVFTALTFSESSARSFRSSFVTKYNEHQDAYVDSISVEFKTFEFWAVLEEIESVKKDFYDFYYESDYFWLKLSEETGVNPDLIEKQIAPLQRILEILSAYDENADMELTKFVEDSLNIYQNLLDQKASGSKFSGAYAVQLLKLTR